MYEHSAHVYDALARHLDYGAACERLDALIRRMVPEARSLLDVGCGTGRYLEHLAGSYVVEGLDLSPEMLEVARERLPGVPLHHGDLVDFRRERNFDVVCCLFGSVGYAKTLENLKRSIRCMAGHLEPGGALIVEPWVTPEDFIADRIVFDTVDDDALKVARMYVSKREGRLSIYDMGYLVGTPAGCSHFTERQELGLFTDGEYQQAFEEAGMELVDPGTELFGYGLYAARLR